MEPKRSLAKVVAFSEDALTHGGYKYSTNASLSSRMANRRIGDAILELVDFRGRTVIDIGCGDGVYTVGILEQGNPSRLHGSDLAQPAVHLGSRRAEAGSITFDVATAHQLPFADSSFDIAHVRGVLHHMDYPQLAIQEALRVARQIVVAEPNGNNLGVKLIERTSPYHREHQEKSYSSGRLNRWVREAGGVITRAKWIGLVPMFSPDWLAKMAKGVEPYLEEAPVLARLACAVYVFVAERSEQAEGMRT